MRIFGLIFSILIVIIVVVVIVVVVVVAINLPRVVAKRKKREGKMEELALPFLESRLRKFSPLRACDVVDNNDDDDDDGNDGSSHPSCLGWSRCRRQLGTKLPFLLLSRKPETEKKSNLIELKDCSFVCDRMFLIKGQDLTRNN